MSVEKPCVAVLIDRVLDGAAPDQQDALHQAESVSAALSACGFAPVLVQASLDLAGFREELGILLPAFAFNLVESLEGRGALIHLVPALLDCLGIPYTGAPADAIYLTSHKLLAKRIMREAGIPTPAHLPATVFLPGGPPAAGTYIIKSVWEHASVGLDEDSVIAWADQDALREAMAARRHALGGNCFAEEYIEGREFNLSILGDGDIPEVLPAAEIRFDGYPHGKRKVVGYRAKWDETSFEYRQTQRSFQFSVADHNLLALLKQLALQCWEVFSLSGYARVDFRVDEDGRPWVLEVNANPCLSADAGFAAAAAAAGLSSEDVVRRIVADIRACGYAA